MQELSTYLKCHRNVKIKLNLCQEILDLYFKMTIVIDAYNIDHTKNLIYLGKDVNCRVYIMG